MRLVIRELYQIQSYGIWLFDERIIDGAKQRYVAKPMSIEMVEMQDQWQLPEPTLTFADKNLNELITSATQEFELSGFGKRFTATKDQEILAVKAHLTDAMKIRDRLMQVVESKL